MKKFFLSLICYAFAPASFLRFLIYRIKAPALVQLGSGPVRGRNGWLNIDMIVGCDIVWDIRFGLLFRSASIEKFYSSHFLEHFNLKDIKLILSEIHRSLKPSGVLLLCLPDSSKYIESYMKGCYFRDVSGFWRGADPKTGCLIDQVNYIAYMGGMHRYMFDQHNIKAILTSAGFSIVEKRNCDPSVDDERRGVDSMYIIAIK